MIWEGYVAGIGRRGMSIGFWCENKKEREAIRKTSRWVGG
jgi:hypothetical protein